MLTFAAHASAVDANRRRASLRELRMVILVGMDAGTGPVWIRTGALRMGGLLSAGAASAVCTCLRRRLGRSVRRGDIARSDAASQTVQRECAGRFARTV